MTRRVAIALGSCALAACQSGSKPRGADDGTTHRYKLEGVVLRVDTEARLASIQHGPITSENGKVWMEAMTMDFPVPKDADLQQLKKGQAIAATVVSRDSDLEYWIEGVRKK